MPGRDGVPLSYVVRDMNAPDPTPHPNFLDDYVSMAPLAGNAFVIDTSQVHTFLMNLISGNDTAEAKVQRIDNQNDGRVDSLRLKEHYQGVGIHGIDTREADATLKTLFYAGEKPPHMWWDEFEKRLN